MIYRQDSLRWRGNALHLNSRPVLHLEPDGTYPNMWRIRMPEGELSDMVNRTRAKDATITIGLGLLNHSDGKKPHGRVTGALNREAATQAALSSTPRKRAA